MSKPVVPNVPPLSGIQDPNTRIALQAISDQLKVRNGDVGTGEHRFLTAADFETAVTGKKFAGFTGSLTGLRNSINNAVAGIIQDATDSIMQSALWKHLDERIKWIETPTWFEGKFGAAIQSERVLWEEADSARAQETTTAITNINGNIALVQQQATAASNLAGATASSVTQLQTSVNGVQSIAQQSLSLSNSIDGQLHGSYGVKFQTQSNGQTYISGFGTDITNEFGVPTSSFIVKADNFAIGSPYSGVASVVPFIVKTTNWTDTSGVTHGPGVYMQNVKIGQATIDNLTVTTSLIAPNAVSVPVFTVQGGDIGGSGITSYITVVTLTYPAQSAASTVFVDASGLCGYTAGLKSTAWRILKDGVTVAGIGPITATYVTTPSVSYVFNQPANTATTITFQWAGGDGTVFISQTTMHALGVKR